MLIVKTLGTLRSKAAVPLPSGIVSPSGRANKKAGQNNSPAIIATQILNFLLWKNGNFTSATKKPILLDKGNGLLIFASCFGN